MLLSESVLDTQLLADWLWVVLSQTELSLVQTFPLLPISKTILCPDGPSSPEILEYLPGLGGSLGEFQKRDESVRVCEWV